MMRTFVRPALLLGLALGPPALHGAAEYGLDQQLQEYRFELRAALQDDYGRFEELQRRAPRAVVLWRDRTYRFPPPPEPSPELETLMRVHPLSALPPAWHGPLNEIGADLFLRGVEDGRRGEVGKPWRRYAAEYEDRSLDRESILPLPEVFPGFDAKEDYSLPPIPFPEWERAAAAVETMLVEIPGARRGPVHLPEDSPAARPLLQALRDHERVAREVGLALRRKAQGLAVRGLLRLQGALYGRAQEVLGHDPRPEDVARLREVLTDRWIGLLTLHHAQQYFAGYNAVTRGQGGSSGSGETDEPFEGQGTGSGRGPAPRLAIEGGGTGSGEPGGTGVGTGDGTVTAEPSSGGTGTGSGNG